MHVAFAEGLHGLERFPLLNITITCGSYVIGTALYITRWPEKRWPGTFDLYVRHSSWEGFGFFSSRALVLIREL